MAHSEKKSKRQMVNGEQLYGQCIIGLPFTVYCLPNDWRSAHCSECSELNGQLTLLISCLLEI
jgi:hypothetical protein